MTQTLVDLSASPSVKLEFDQGSLVSSTFGYREADGTTVIPLTGFGARMAFRDLNLGSVLLSMTTTNGKLVIDEAAGNVDWTILPSDTGLASAFAGIYVGVWDIYLDPSGVSGPTSFKWLGGRWEMTPEVTP